MHGSPFSVPVRAGAVSPAQCSAHGRGLSYAVLNRAANFLIRLHDAFGNTLHGAGGADGGGSSSGGVVGVRTSRVDGAVGPKAAVHDRQNGTHGVEYTPTEAGVLLLHVTVDGQPISGCPFSVLVSETGARLLKRQRADALART